MTWTVSWAGHPVPIQYDLRDRPWRLLVACTLLRRARGGVVKETLDEVFDRWPGPLELLTAPVIEVVETLRPCGFQNVRTRAILSLTIDYLQFVLKHRRVPRHFEVAQWRGVGPYITQSYRLFVDRLPMPADLVPVDHVLQCWINGPFYDQYLMFGRITI